MSASVAGYNRRHLSEPAMLLSLDNDAVTQVLSDLTADELARFVCASHGRSVLGLA